MDNLKQLKEKVLELNADVGLSFDGDGDRLGVVTGNAKFIPSPGPASSNPFLVPFLTFIKGVSPATFRV